MVNSTVSNEAVSQAGEECNRALDAVSDVFVGQRYLLRKLLAAAVGGGHVLFEDFPGLGKTLLAKTFAKVIGCAQSRVQFTPDMLPADILGTKIWRPQTGDFSLLKGPVFTEVLLADEINRAPPKTQAALLEAMEERQVTLEGETYQLSKPFLVMATQNPIEQEGTYPLPEAQLDRFMFKLATGYPDSLARETEILARRASIVGDDLSEEAERIFDQKRFIEIQQMSRSDVYVDPTILEYISLLVRETRDHEDAAVGASPRGGVALLNSGKAMALIHGRDFMVPDDVKEVALDALSHRIILHTEVILDGVKEESVVQSVLDKVPVPIGLSERPDESSTPEEQVEILTEETGSEDDEKGEDGEDE